VLQRLLVHARGFNLSPMMGTLLGSARHARFRAARLPL
jgi:hypothetical protein